MEQRRINDGGTLQDLTTRDLIALVVLHGMLSSPPVGDRTKAEADTWTAMAFWWADSFLRVRQASQPEKP